MKYLYTKYLISIAFIFYISNTIINAQTVTRKELEKQKKETQEKISQANELLEQTKKNKKESLNQLMVYHAKVNYRREVIAIMQNEIELVENNINENLELIENFKRDLLNIRDEYAKMIITTYKNSKGYQNKWMYVLAAESFNQAYNRIIYLQQINESRKKQIQLIDAIKIVLEEKNSELVDFLKEKNVLVKTKEEETFVLNREIEKGEEIVKKLKQQERSLQDEIKTMKEQAAKIDEQILKVIEEEIRKEKEKKNVVKKNENIKLSDNFEANKGKFPWPVEKGIVIKGYGIYNHPVQKGIKLKNEGIDIISKENCEAKCIYNGEVRRIFQIPHGYFAIIVSHGKFMTVYSNISDVYVKEGEKINTGVALGKIGTDFEEGKSILHFEIREQFTSLDPVLWLVRGK